MEIKPSTSLRNQYNEISEYCKATGEPVYLTKNGEGDLVVLSIEAYELIKSLVTLNKELQYQEALRMCGEEGYSLEDATKLWKETIKNS